MSPATDDAFGPASVGLRIGRVDARRHVGRVWRGPPRRWRRGRRRRPPPARPCRAGARCACRGSSRPCDARSLSVGWSASAPGRAPRRGAPGGRLRPRQRRRRCRRRSVRDGVGAGTAPRRQRATGRTGGRLRSPSWEISAPPPLAGDGESAPAVVARCGGSRSAVGARVADVTPRGRASSVVPLARRRSAAVAASCGRACRPAGCRLRGGRRAGRARPRRDGRGARESLIGAGVERVARGVLGRDVARATTRAAVVLADLVVVACLDRRPGGGLLLLLRLCLGSRRGSRAGCRRACCRCRPELRRGGRIVRYGSAWSHLLRIVVRNADAGQREHGDERRT